MKQVSMVARSSRYLALSSLALTLIMGASSLGHAAGETCANEFQFTQLFVPPQARADGKVVDKTEKKDSVLDLAEVRAIYEANNKKLADRYPSFDFVLKDPEAFIGEMRQRFEAQKKITPDDPRLFDFPEAAPTMKFIADDLATFRQELITELQKEKATLRNRLSHMVLNERSKKVENLTKALSYVNELQTNIATMINSNKYPYLDTVSATYFFSRIRGYFQFSQLNTYNKITLWLDMVMHGYRKKSIEVERELLKSGDSPIVHVRSGKIAHEFRIAEIPFKEAFDRKDYLEYVVVPSVFPLGGSAFMHVLPHNVHFIGATNSPIKADGFDRPGGLFWAHDGRHEADRYMKVRGYIEQQKATPEQWNALQMYMHKWQNEFIAMKNKITDPDLKKSVEHYHFYIHHDVGVPMTPSMFLNLHAGGIQVYVGFLFHKRFAGQGPGFNNWAKNTKETQRILEAFWRERAAIEKEILGHEPVVVKDWDNLFGRENKK